MRKSFIAAAIIASGLVAVQSRAAVYTLTDDVDGAFDNTNDFDPIAFTLNPATHPAVYEIPVFASVGSLGAGQTGFGNLDITGVISGPGGATFDANGFGGSTDTYKSGKTFVSYFAGGNDGQAGTKTADALEAVVSINAGVSATTDPRFGMGQAGNSYNPVLLGFFYVDLPANDSANNTFTVTINDQGTNDAGVLTPDTASAVLSSAPAPINFIIPEPASLSLVGIGAMGLLARRRKTA